MPTSVSAARQCLTDDAARALDDAVSVARRRSHAQTTSLHAVSALLSLPTAALRDACGRAGSCSYSPRLQLRALELSVGVSLDRLQTSKTAADGGGDDGPPVSNSLMAAIRRAQANQRRHPESFHLLQMMQQQNQNQNQHQTASLLKAELKHFILSILDDPIVSRVFAEAGFRSYDIKLALLRPPPPPPFSSSPSSSSRFFSRAPPVFLCNIEPARSGFPFRFSGSDDNSGRIADVLARKSKRNPLLVGGYAKSALRSFTESVQMGKAGFLPPELSGLCVVSISKEISEFLVEGGSEEKMGLKIEEVGRSAEQSSGPGVVVCYGEVEDFVNGGGGGGVGFVVSRLKGLLEVHGGKIWLVGVAGNSEAYSKLIRLFPTLDKDWDLHLLTVTNPTPSMEGLYPKSSLMGSFVPLGGFFSTPSDFRNPGTNAPLARCDTCNEKCEQELADTVKVGPATSASSHPTSLPWLQKVNVETDRGLDLAKTNEGNTSSNAKVSGLQRKWSDICHRLHQNRSLSEIDTSRTRFQAPFHENGSGVNQSCSKSPSLNEIQYPGQISYVSKELQSAFPSKQILPVSAPLDTVSVNDEANHTTENSRSDMQSTWVSLSPKANMNLLDHRTSLSLTPVTTELVLGTKYSSAAHEPDTPKASDHRMHPQHLSDSFSTDFDAVNETASQQIARSSSCSGPHFEGKFETLDFKSLYQLLIEKVGRQDKAIYDITRTISLCKSGVGKRSGSRVRGDVWLAFLGPDRLGKRKIASALAETLFGNRQSVITVDLSFQESSYQLNSVIEFQNSCCHDVLGRNTVVDYIAGELSKKPHSVVFLENIEKAKILVQSSLFQAIRTGRFPYSRGREIGINNAVFIVTSSVFKGNGSFDLEEVPKMFPEERILEAKRCQIQLSLGHASEDARRSGSKNVKVAQRKGTSKPTFLNKRKLSESSDSKEDATGKVQKQEREASRSFLDLNMPLEEVEEGINDSDCESQSMVENSEAWLSDFCDQIDGEVVFKPFNFDSLSELVIECVDTQFQRTFGSEFLLEIDYEVMAQILAAAWLSDKKEAVEDWIEHVIGRSFAKAQQKYHHPGAEYVMKLVNCESIFVEEQAPEVCLPARINLN